MLKLIKKYTKQYKYFAIFGPIFVFTESICEILIPLYMSRLIDNGINKKVIIILCFLSLCALVLGILSSIFSIKASNGFATNLRLELFKKIQNFSSNNIDKFGVPSIITRMTKDIQRLQDTYQMTVRMAIRCPIITLLSFIMIYRLSPKLSIIFWVLIPLIIIMIAFALSTLLNPLRKLFTQYDKLNQNVEENLLGIRVIKTYNTINKETKNFFNIASILAKIQTFLDTMIMSFYSILRLLNYIAIILIVYFGGKMVISNTLTTGVFLSLITYSSQILGNLLEFGFILSGFAMSKEAVRRINEVFNEKNEILIKKNPITHLNNFDIEFKDVSFNYTNTHNVLNNITFKLKQGESLGIIGTTGSGKTSLVHLLLRLYEVNSGKILIGNENIKNIDISYLRNIVSLVSQKNTLFKSNVRNNMLWASEKLTDTEILEAIKGVQADNFIDNLDNKVEQLGSNFSGGQKQRLYIARSLLKNSKIIILDDSTSAIDTKTDKKIKDFLNKNYKNSTKIIISQRISSIINCDKIMVIEDGKITNIDTHENLLKISKIYREFYEIQKGGGNFDEQ